MGKLAKVKRVRQRIYIVLTLFTLLATQHIASGSKVFYLPMQISTFVDTPPLVLQNVTNSFIYTNSTSAKVTISNKTESADVLQIINQTSDSNWQIQLMKYDDMNINRLINCTVWFHNETTTSAQIKIINGIYNQINGTLYDFTPNTNITITAITNTTGTSLIYTHLKVLKRDTSTYSLYIIAFEITDPNSWNTYPALNG